MALPSRIPLLAAATLPALALLALALSREPAEGPSAIAPPACDDALCPAGGPTSESLEAALALACERALPVLALFGPPRATCPPVRHVEDRLFTAAARERLSRCCVPVRVELGAAWRGFVERGEIPSHHPPSFLVLSPHGRVLHVQAAGLYPFFGDDGRAVEAEPADLLEIDDLCRLVSGALDRRGSDDARLTALAPSGRVEDALERATLLAHRGCRALAIEVAEEAAAREVPSAAVRPLARLLSDLGRVGSARSLLARSARLRPDAPELPRWLLEQRRLAQRGAKVPGTPTARVAPPPTEPEVFEALRSRPDLVVEALVRHESALQALLAGDREAVVEALDWARAHADVRPDDPAEAAALWLGRSQLSRETGRHADALRWARDLVATCPDSNEALILRHGGLERLRIAASP